jgi:hypothetical protein
MKNGHDIRKRFLNAVCALTAAAATTEHKKAANEEAERVSLMHTLERFTRTEIACDN